MSKNSLLFCGVFCFNLIVITEYCHFYICKRILQTTSIIPTRTFLVISLAAAGTQATEKYLISTCRGYFITVGSVLVLFQLYNNNNIGLLVECFILVRLAMVGAPVPG